MTGDRFARHRDNPVEDLGTDYETSAAENDLGQSVVDGLVRLLDLEPIEEDIFRGRSPKVAVQRIFGGQVAGQALVAAGRTVDTDRVVHSLHSYFIRPGDPSVPIVYNVDRVRDGRSFTVRRVVAVQHGKPIFSLSASFQFPESGVDHQPTMPPAPDPLTLRTALERYEPFVDDTPPFHKVVWPFDLRYVDNPSWEQRPAGPTVEGDPYRLWMKTTGTLPDDPLLHACVLTFASDLTLMDSILVRHGVTPVTDVASMASLDHAVWFHRPIKADEWLLYTHTSPTASGSRGLATGRIYSRAGELLATVVQEGVIRLKSDLPQ